MKLLVSVRTSVIWGVVTIPEIAAELRMALTQCLDMGKGVPLEERSFFRVLKNASDEEIIASWLSLSYFGERHVSMTVAKRWAKEAEEIGEWIALLEWNTAPHGNN